MKFKIIISALIITLSNLVFAEAALEGIAEAPLEEIAEAPLEETAQSLTPEEQEYIKQANAMLDSLNMQTGAIKLPNAVATLNVPEQFYFLDSADAEKVLVDIWGNPPGQNVLGMIFPAGVTPYDSESWAVSIEYEEDGYVSDEDAGDMDYDELLETMKEDTRLISEDRVKEGYEGIELIGWASNPYYDTSSHKMHWAKELKFGTDDAHTLNYNIRVLGRKGVLVLNFIADMSQKETIQSNLDAVLALAEFDQGAKYSDFNPELDTVAAYGLGALVAGKVLAKTGFIAAALLFLKKFGIIIVIAIGAFVKKIFFGKKEES